MNDDRDVYVPLDLLVYMRVRTASVDMSKEELMDIIKDAREELLRLHTDINIKRAKIEELLIMIEKNPIKRFFKKYF